jgi:hypothetical protein
MAAVSGVDVNVETSACFMLNVIHDFIHRCLSDVWRRPRWWGACRHVLAAQCLCVFRHQKEAFLPKDCTEAAKVATPTQQRLKERSNERDVLASLPVSHARVPALCELVGQATPSIRGWIDPKKQSTNRCTG